MKFCTLCAVTAATVVPTVAMAAPITSATFSVVAPATVADSDSDGAVDNALTFASITAGGITYTQFTYGTASVASANAERLYTTGEPVMTAAAALGGSIVTDGILNATESTRVMFNRPITANDVIIFTDVRTSGNGSVDKVGLYLLDSTGARIANTGQTFGNIGSGGSALVTVDLERSGTSSPLVDATIWGEAHQLTDFKGNGTAPSGYTGTGAWGIDIGSTGSGTVDPTIIALATVPEPAFAALAGMMLGGLVLRPQRRR